MTQFFTQARSLAVIGVVALLSASSARAQQVYNSVSSFESASTGLVDVGFNGIVPAGGFTDFVVPPGYTSPQGVNFTFQTLTAEHINITSSTFYGAGTYQNDFLIPASDVVGAPTWQITLPTPSTAIGIDLGTFSGGSMQFSFSSGDTYLDPTTAAYATTSFIGFTFSSPVTSLTFVSPGGDGFNVVDDFKFGQAASVAPEPGSLAFAIVAGIGVFGWSNRSPLRRVTLS